MKRFARLVVALIASLLLLPATVHLRVATGNDAWINRDGAAWSALAETEQRFGRADGFVVAIFAPDVLSVPCLAWQQTIADRIRQIPGVTGLDGLNQAQDVQVDDQGVSAVLLIPDDFSTLAPADQAVVRARVLAHPLYRNLLVNQAGTAAALIVKLDRALDEQGVQKIERSMSILLKSTPPPTGMSAVLGGLPAQKQAINQAVIEDQKLTVPLSITIHACLMLLILRLPILVAIPLASIGTTLVWTYASLALMGRPLDAVLGLLPPLVMGVAVASSLHLIFGYARLRLAGEPSPLREVLLHARLPLSLCVLTTCAGVLGLLWGPVEAVRVFAPFASVGIALAAIAPILWLWALSPWIDRSTCQRLVDGPFGHCMGRWLCGFTGWCKGHAKVLLACAVVLAGVCVWALSDVPSDADFLHALPVGNPVRYAHERIDRELTGVLALDVLIDVGHRPGAKDLDGLRAVQAVMHQEPSIATSLSLADVIDVVAARTKEHGHAADPGEIVDDLSVGAPAVWKQFVGASLPEDETKLFSARVGLASMTPPPKHRTASTMRILARQHDASMAGNAAAAQRAVVAATQAFPGAKVLASSGSLVLDETSQAMIPATLRSILLPLPCIALLLWLTTRSLRLACLAIPIAGLPLLITYAQLWPLGWPIDIGVSMIACVGLGMIVDDTVRMFLALRAEERGQQEAAASIGPVLVGGCLAMAGSFIACLAGQFAYTRHFGVLLAAAFLIALLVNMTLTPALLALLAPRTPRAANTAQKGKV